MQKDKTDRRNPERGIVEAKALLEEAARRVRAALRDELIMPETPLEVQDVMEAVADSIEAALSQLEAIVPKKAQFVAARRGPTRQQGQFLAFIREFMMRNEAGLAPTHAELQRFFNLTPPSVNSMLIRLEQRGFIRRVPGRARAIEITIRPDWIPPLERPFKFRT